MRTRTILISGAAAIAALGLGAVFFLTAVRGPTAAVASAPHASSPSAAQAEAVPPPLPIPQGERPAAVPAVAIAVAEPPRIEWAAVPVSARPSELGAEISGAVLRGLQAARDRMDPCFDAETQRLRARPASGQGTPILTLDLENGPGNVVVKDVEVDAAGRASPELLECCEGVLRGWQIPAPAAPPAERHRLRYVLQ